MKDSPRVSHEGHAHEPQAGVVSPVTPAPVRAPAAPAWLAAGAGFAPAGALAPRVLALSRTAGNAAVARAIASGRLVSRDPAPPAAAADAPAPPAAPQAPVADAPAVSMAPFAELLTTVEGWSPREDTLQA
jgi:hypothetical protein